MGEVVGEVILAALWFRFSGRAGGRLWWLLSLTSCLLEALHGVAALGEVVLLDKDPELDVLAARGPVRVLDVLQVPGHERKEVAGLVEGVHPDSIVLSRPRGPRTP